MAHAGGACTAYRCRIERKQLRIMPTTTLRSECSVPSWAADALSIDYPVTVAGSDMPELITLLAQRGVQVGGKLTHIDMLRYEALSLWFRIKGWVRAIRCCKRNGSGAGQT